MFHLANLHSGESVDVVLSLISAIFRFNDVFVYLILNLTVSFRNQQQFFLGDLKIVISLLLDFEAGSNF